MQPIKGDNCQVGTCLRTYRPSLAELNAVLNPLIRSWQVAHKWVPHSSLFEVFCSDS